MLEYLLGPQYSTARLSWLTTRVANPSLELARGLVFLFRGTGAWFTPGFGALADWLRSEGFWVEDLRSVGDGWACRWLMAQQLRLPIILVGHSRGGRRALLAASRLQQAGKPVEVLICIDVAFPPVVPGNVCRAVHLYRSRWRLYPARPLQPASDFTGSIENIDLDQPDSPIQERWLHHLNITGSQKVKDWVVGTLTSLPSI